MRIDRRVRADGRVSESRCDAGTTTVEWRRTGKTYRSYTMYNARTVRSSLDC